MGLLYLDRNMRGRDEGLLVISAYRVMQKKGAAAGPNTAHNPNISSTCIQEVSGIPPNPNDGFKDDW